MTFRFRNAAIQMLDAQFPTTEGVRSLGAAEFFFEFAEVSADT